MLQHHIYHVYNRGNNRQKIFFSRRNYLYFLQKMRTHLLPSCSFLAYCLMPNHFHFLVRIEGGGTTIFSQGLRILLSSYTRAIHKQEKMTGSLFQQNTKSKLVSSEWSWEDYTLVCFRYVLQNPVAAGLVLHPADWEFSSYRDLVGLRKGTLCDAKLLRHELALETNTLDDLMGIPLLPDEVARIF